MSVMLITCVELLFISFQPNFSLDFQIYIQIFIPSEVD